MVMLVEDLDLAYFPCPKIACTSVKLCLYEINNGRKFENFYQGGRKKFIHSMFPSRHFYDDEGSEVSARTRFAVVRDPVKRLMSAYQNRVAQQGDLRKLGLLGRATLLAHGLPAHPDPDAFFENIEIYRAASNRMRRHTDPISAYLGPDLGYFTHVFTLERLPDLEAFLSERSGRAVVLPHEKRTSGPGLRFGDLGPRARRAVLGFAAGDYALVRGLYEPPA